MYGKTWNWIALPLFVACVVLAIQGIARANIRASDIDTVSLSMKAREGTINKARSLPLIIAAVDEPDTNCKDLGTCLPKR
jgi:hypothetical protein